MGEILLWLGKANPEKPRRLHEIRRYFPECPEKLRKLEFPVESTREERAAQRENLRDSQRVPLMTSTEY